MELPDLNLLTYVIKFQSGRYFTNGDDSSWEPGATNNLVEANIYNDPTEAKRLCKNMPDGATVHPVSKKIFFEAALKGER